MNTAGIICEYNPFHNGHKYQIDCVKSNHDAIVCIMSGSFVQRGDTAVFDKWTRANSALLSGADLVIELPVCFSLNTAERFAFGGISLLNSLGIIDSLIFGSECGNIDKLSHAADLLCKESPEISEKIKKAMSEGISYPSAKASAYSEKIDAKLISEPNNILGIEYIKALKSTKSTITPITIKRYGSEYHSLNIHDNIASASAIRMLMNNSESWLDFVPENTHHLYKSHPISDRTILDSILRYTLLTKSAEELAKINDVSEGLENRIKSAAQSFCTFDEIAEFVKSKRYTLARIRRILLSAVIGIDKEICQNQPEYIRILAMNKTGMELLSQIKKKSDIPVITKTADFKGFNKSLELDIFSTDIYSLLKKQPVGADFYNSPVIIKS